MVIPGEIATAMVAKAVSREKVSAWNLRDSIDRFDVAVCIWPGRVVKPRGAVSGHLRHTHDEIIRCVSI